MKTKAIFWLAAVVLPLALSACGFIKGLFPDKEKDYQYTSEIAPLVYPKDLAKGGAPSFAPTDLADSSPVQASVVPESAALPEKIVPTSTAQPAATDEKNSSGNAPAGNTDVAKAAANNGSEKHAVTKHIPIANTVLKDGNVQLLRVEADFDTVWRAVNKALSRQSVEVIDRNGAAQQVTLRYENPADSAANRSLWDETLYILSGMPSTDKQYTLKFSPHGQQTDVAVYNEQQQPVADDSSLSLLKLLQNAI